MPRPWRQFGDFFGRNSARGIALCLALLSACGGQAAGRPRNPRGDQSPPPPAASISLEHELRTTLEQRVRNAEANQDAQVSVRFEPSAWSRGIVHVRALSAHGHGQHIELIELDAKEPGAARVRVVQSLGPPQVKLGAAPEALLLASGDLDVAEAHRVLERIRVLASAVVHIDEPVAAQGEIALRPIVVTDNDQVLLVQFCPEQGSCVLRNFAGYVNNRDEPERAPLQLVWEALVALRAPVETRLPSTDDARLLVELWRDRPAWPQWAERRMLALAAALPSRALVPLLLPALDAEAVLRDLAINALAAAMVPELLRDSAGELRPAEELVEEFKRRGRE